jgi:hypothetical protein
VCKLFFNRLRKTEQDYFSICFADNYLAEVLYNHSCQATYPAGRQNFKIAGYVIYFIMQTYINPGTVISLRSKNLFIPIPDSVIQQKEKGSGLLFLKTSSLPFLLFTLIFTLNLP